MSVDIIELITKSLESSKSDGSPMEIALSKVLVLFANDIISKTILPKRKIKDLSLLEDDIFFKEKIDNYKENLRNTKAMVKLKAELIKHIATGLHNRETSKLLSFFKKGKENNPF